MAMIVVPATARRFLPRRAAAYAQQVRGCSAEAETAAMQRTQDHLAAKLKHLADKKRRLQDPEAVEGLTAEEAKKIKDYTQNQYKQARKGLVNLRLYGEHDEAFEAVVNDEQGIPSFNDPYMSPEMAQQAGVRDIREDAGMYEVALETLAERGTDVHGLFSTVGCPAPFAVFLHLLTKHKHESVRLGDRHIGAVLQRMAGEIRTVARAGSSTDSDDLPSTLQQALDMRNACLDNQIPFEFHAHAALLKVAAYSGDLEAACDVFKELVALARPEEYCTLMDVALRVGEAEFAAELLEECLEKQPRALQEHAGLAAAAVAAYATLGDSEKLKGVTEESGGEANPRVNREVLKAMCGRGMWDEANEFYARVLRPNEGARRSPEILAAFLGCAERINDVDKMVALVEEAANAAGGQGASVVTLAHIHALMRALLHSRGSVAGAMAVLRMAGNLSLAPSEETGALLATGVLHCMAQQMSDDAAAPLAPVDVEEVWCEVSHAKHTWTPTADMVSSLVEAAARGATLAAADHDPAQPAEVWVRLSHRILYSRAARATKSPIRDDALTAFLLAAAQCHKTGDYFLSAKDYIQVYRRVRAPTVAARYALSEAFQSMRGEFGVILRLLRDSYGDLESKVLPPGAVQGEACGSLGELAQSVRGLSRVYVLSSLTLLRERPEAAVDCSKLLIPFSLLAKEVMGEADDLREILALPHVDVIRLPEHVLAHAAAEALNALGHFDLSLVAHRCICFAMVLGRVAQGHGCTVEVLASSAGDSTGPAARAADALGVPIRRI
eukprot:TRINITY_DN2171_c0_g3_i1.p1 TRINITY_DN2171_c0_g3~~TRINITY_DN2171_c0_g3_i1.p1  ORF type:complete len:784 (+),score=210.63 TRINITY_DN2171_c0_g3_i1:1801-4152(+)